MIDTTTIINTAKTTVKKGIKATNEIGSSVQNYAKDLSEHADTFIKEHEFTNNIAQKAKNNKVGKDTVIGALTIATVTYLAGKCLFGLKNKISDMIKKDK